MKNWLKDEYVVLSGASRGIGRELAKLLICRYGAKVIGIGRKEDKMLSLQSELGEKAADFSYRLFDVSDKDAWFALKTELAAAGIRPALLINNAGMFPTFCKTLDTPIETVEQITRVNYFSIAYAVSALKDVLKEKGGIVNVSSSAALCSVVGTSAYSASKAAVKGYTEALALEERGKLYIGLIHPGTTATELFDADENVKESMLQKIAMKPEKMAAKIARAVVKRKCRKVLGWDAKMMNFLAKVAPVRGIGIVANVMKASKSKVFTNVFDYEKKGEKK